MRKSIEYLRRKSPLFLISAGLAVILLIGIVDLLTGSELSVFILYLFPVLVVTALAGLSAGLLMSAFGATVWLTANLIHSKVDGYSFIPYWNAVVRLGFLTIVAVLQDALARERILARTDSLTGIANRKSFFDTAETEIQRSRRYGLVFSAAYIDVDDFKQVNDRFGHATGDRLLSAIAQVIQHNIRTVDMVARIGGDEFALLLPETDAESAKAVLSKLTGLLQQVFDDNRWPVTLSCGVVSFLKPPASADEIVRKTDELMYDAKTRSKNIVRYGVYG